MQRINLLAVDQVMFAVDQAMFGVFILGSQGNRFQLWRKGTFPCTLITPTPSVMFIIACLIATFATLYTLCSISLLHLILYSLRVKNFGAITAFTLII